MLDADGNASWDLVAAAGDGLTVLKTQTPQPGRWTVRSAEEAAEGSFDRLRQLDYDNDGLPDLLARERGRPVLLHNLGGEYENTNIKLTPLD